MKLSFTIVIFLFASSLLAQPPAGYYNSTTGLTCADLKTTLKTIITNGFNQQSYGDLWSRYETTDVKPREVGTGSSVVIWDIYSEKPGPANDPYNFTPGTGTGGQQDQGQGGNVEGEWYNREHTVPLSWFGGSTSGPGADYLHIFPVDKAVNGKRASWPYGEVGTASFTSMNGSKLGNSSIAGVSGTVFEPIDSFKGDVARAFLYFVTRYEDNMPTYGNNTEALQAFEPNKYPSVDVPFLQMMLNWHLLDPVSNKEQLRNNGAYSFQKNRNPYVDRPEFVNLVWNALCPGLSTLPVDIVSFKGKLIGENIYLDWVVKNEQNLGRYEIERSFNGASFETIGQVNASKLEHYTFRDDATQNRGRQVYYRLRKIDKDGKYKYSQVLVLHIPFNTRFTVYPNPATTKIQLQINRDVVGKIVIEIADLSGKVLIRKITEVEGATISIATNKLAAGTYIVKMLYNDEQYIQKVVVVK